MAQLQKDFLALIPNLKNTNLNSFDSIHFIDAENMIGRVTFKSNYVKRYVALLNEFFEQYLKVYDDKESLFIFSAHREYVASSSFLYKGLEKKNVYLIVSNRSQLNQYELFVGVTRAILNLEINIVLS